MYEQIGIILLCIKILDIFKRFDIWVGNLLDHCGYFDFELDFFGFKYKISIIKKHYVHRSLFHG